MNNNLGYIHLSWQGYENAGIDWDRGYTKNQSVNANINMFRTAQKHVLDAARQLKRQDLQKLEDDYNTNIKTMTKQIQKLLKEAQQSGNNTGIFNFYKALAENAQFKENVANTIASHMQYKNDSNVLTQSTGIVQSTGGGFSIENASHFTSQEGQWHKVETLKKAIKKLQARMDVADDDIKVLDDYKKAYNYIEKILKILDSIASNEVYQDKLRKKLKDITKQKGIIKQEGIISHKVAKAIVENIQNVLININNVQYINRRINQYYAELEGAALAQLGNILAAKSINDVVRILNNTSRGGSQKSQVSINQQFVFSDTIFNDYLQNNPAFKNLIKKEKLEESIGKDAYLKIFRDYSVDNKADIIYEFGGKEANISMKNVNLHSSEIVNDDFGFPEISLQDSSLLLYLSGIDQPKGIMEHYLNVLAQHDDQDNSFNTIRDQANKTLLLTMLYQALTGEMQNRKGGTNANVFAIKDSKTGYVKFFDMGQIVEDAFNGDIFKVVSSSPDIRKLELKNEKEAIKFEKGKSTKQLRWEAAKRRSQKVFFEARLQNIKIGIAKWFLK